MIYPAVKFRFGKFPELKVFQSCNIIGYKYNDNIRIYYYCGDNIYCYYFEWDLKSKYIKRRIDKRIAQPSSSSPIIAKIGNETMHEYAYDSVDINSRELRSLFNIIECLL